MIRCDAPGCRAGILHVGAFGKPCPTCNGKGELNLAQVSRLLDEDEAIIRKLVKMRGRMRPKTCARILDKVALVIWPTPKKQPELFV